MKTKELYISIILTSFLMLLTININAQTKNKHLFLRVFTLDGNKVKGNILNFNDSLLVLQRGQKEFSIESKNIRTIKTKRSGGRAILAGGLIGGIAGTLIGYSGGDDESGIISFSKEDKAGIGGLIGAIIGSGVGALTIPSNSPKKYIIEGDLDKWKLFIKAEDL